MLLTALIYYGFSIYFDAQFYNVTELPIFKSRDSDYYPSIVYLYSWLVPLLVAMSYLATTPRTERHSRSEKVYANREATNIIVLLTGVILYTVLILRILPAADSRANVFLIINRDYTLLSWLLPIVVWLSCFVILTARHRVILYCGIGIVLLISLTLVDRSYLMMGLIAGAVRIKKIGLIKLLLLICFFLVLFTFWKVVLFWLVFDVDLSRSIQNVQFGLARFEAITSQSIFINCVENELCENINFEYFVLSTISRIVPSVLFDLNLPSSQQLYIDQFYPEIAARGGGLGFSLVAEFSLVFGVLFGPIVLSVYIICLIQCTKFIKSSFITFILTLYWFRFLRVDFGTGIKGIIVFGCVSLCIYMAINILFSKGRKYVKHS